MQDPRHHQSRFWPRTILPLLAVIVAVAAAIPAASATTRTLGRLKGSLLATIGRGHPSTAVLFLMGPNLANKQAADRYSGTLACDRSAVDLYVGALATGNKLTAHVATLLELIDIAETLGENGLVQTAVNLGLEHLFPAETGRMTTVPDIATADGHVDAASYLEFCGTTPGFTRSLIAPGTGITSDMRAGKAVRSIIPRRSTPTTPRSAHNAHRTRSTHALHHALAQLRHELDALVATGRASAATLVAVGPTKTNVALAAAGGRQPSCASRAVHAYIARLAVRLPTANYPIGAEYVTKAAADASGTAVQAAVNAAGALAGRTVPRSPDLTHNSATTAARDALTSCLTTSHPAIRTTHPRHEPAPAEPQLMRNVVKALAAAAPEIGDQCTTSRPATTYGGRTLQLQCTSVTGVYVLDRGSFSGWERVSQLKSVCGYHYVVGDGWFVGTITSLAQARRLAAMGPTPAKVTSGISCAGSTLP